MSESKSTNARSYVWSGRTPTIFTSSSHQPQTKPSYASPLAIETLVVTTVLSYGGEIVCSKKMEETSWIKHLSSVDQ